MHVDDDRWKKVNQAFFAALDVDPQKRHPLLKQICGNDPFLLQEVVSLIQADQQAGDSFLQEPACDIYEQSLNNAIRQPLEGRKFGPYCVLREIEHGGMGEIYLAERSDDQYRKQVAIKIIRSGLSSAWWLRQFRAERQILADLDHPYIARLLDGGTTEDGVPYLVMEYVDGNRIDKYCATHGLSIAKRLQLFLKVCSAVHYAHQHNIIHRDLKPNNILITPTGDPKLLDFGVAKLLNQKLSLPSANRTTTGRWLMTPEYASPEQLRGHAVAVSTDIYSLGVLLYELLTGHHPYRLANLAPHEILHAICETEPEKPSSCVQRAEKPITPDGTAILDAAATGDFHNERPDRLRRRLAGDLDNIILMAIRKEPQHRYSSVEQLAQDIRRHLERLPVIARKNTLVYRAGRFVRRNQLRVAAGILVIIGLVLGGAAARWQGEREKQQLRTNLLHRLNNILEAHDEERGLVVNTSSVIFDPGHVNLNADARERLARIAGIFLAYPNLKLQVEGYTDNHGDNAYNVAISHERARAVEAYLISQGIPSGIITAKGLGGVKPIATNDTEPGRQQNRRVEIVVSGDVIGNRISPYSLPSVPNFVTASTSRNSSLVQAMQEPTPGSNLALSKVASSSIPCNANEGPDKAFNGSLSGGSSDKWCSHAASAFLQVDLGMKFVVDQFIVRHAAAGGELPVLNTRNFNIQISTNGRSFATVVNVTGNTRDVTVHTIPPAIVRFVRLNITAPAQHGDYSSRIYEFEVYCDAAKAKTYSLANGSAGPCRAI